jgi:spermidine synthase
MREAVLIVCFFLSGGAGLLYQVLWLRTLTLLFGHTVYAVTTVLAAFMAGLALGSLLFARLSSRLRNLIAAYGWIELAIGVACAAVPALLGVTSAVYLRLYTALGLSAGQFSLALFGLVFALLVVPTTLMGGTLPVLAQALVHDERLGRRVGLLYAANTLGAVIGTVLAGYVLLPALGIRRTTVIAVLINLVVGGLGLLLARCWPRTGAVAPRAVPTDQRWTTGQRLIVAAFGVSGAVSMLYEVAWTRALALVLGSSTYAFTAMLVAFLVGIALGSAVYAWLRGRVAAGPATLGGIQLAIGVVVAVTLALFGGLPELVLQGLARSEAPTWIHLVQIGVASVALLPSTLLIGATFPCAVAAVARARDVGRDVGHVYAVNTLGAIVGVVVTGFLLVPVLGVHGTIKLGALVNLGVAAVLLATSGGRRRWAATAAAVALGAGTWSIPLWDLRVMAGGPAIYWKYYLARGGFGQRTAEEKVVFYRDGSTGTVAVVDAGATRTLRVNGKTDASDGVDMRTQVLLGHIPMLAHPDPKNVMILGLGSGITVGSAGRHAVERIDVVELEPAVAEASRYFSRVNREPLKHPAVRLVLADGRNFLLTTPLRYDVIVSEPSSPWIAGVATLFTVEFFEIARARLRPGGVMAQWLQGYNLAFDDFAMIVRTFRSVFPSTSVWYFGNNDFLLLGTERGTRFDLDRLRARLEVPPVLDDLKRVGIGSWPEVLGLVALAPDDAGAVGGAELNDDDRLPLEFRAPRALYRPASADVLNAVLRVARTGATGLVAGGSPALDRPALREGMAGGLFLVGRFQDALEQYDHAIRLDPHNGVVLRAAAVTALNLNAFERARDYAWRAVTRAPEDAEAHYYLGLALAQLGRMDAAALALTRAAALNPADARVQEALAALRR